MQQASDLQDGRAQTQTPPQKQIHTPRMQALHALNTNISMSAAEDGELTPDSMSSRISPSPKINMLNVRSATIPFALMRPQ